MEATRLSNDDRSTTTLPGEQPSVSLDGLMQHAGVKAVPVANPSACFLLKIKSTARANLDRPRLGLLAVVRLMKTRMLPRFPLARAGRLGNLTKPRRMNRLLTFVAISAVSLFVACISSSESAKSAHSLPGASTLVTWKTSDLEARRTVLKSEITAIEREVEMKAGLHMGVVISDERGRLTDLYREANLIERELQRRSAYSKL